MLDPDRRRRSSSGRILDALLWGAALGAASGAVLGGAIDGVGAGLGAVIGAALYAPAEVITSIRRGPAEPKPLWHRILSSTLLMALFGWLLGLIYGPDEPLLTGIISGTLVGLLGLRPGKAALGLLIGAVLGGVFQVLDSSLEPALIAAAVTLVYRVIAAIAYRGQQLVRVMAEEVPASELLYVVPFEGARGTSAPTTSSNSRRSAAAHSAATRPTSASSPRSTTWTGRTSTRVECTR